MCYDGAHNAKERSVKRFLFMPRKSKTTQWVVAHEQPYDSSLRALIEDQTLAMLSYFFGEEVLWAEELLLESRYRVLALWKEEAGKLLASGRVELYTLLPTMKGATSEVLTQGLRAMRVFYVGDESRLCMHWLWFGTLLDRSTTVSQQDKERTRIEMSESESLLDSNPFVRDRVAKGEARGEARGRVEGETKGLQEALIIAVELRFPALLDLAQERAKPVKRPDTLRLALHGVKTAPSEEVARSVLEMLAA